MVGAIAIPAEVPKEKENLYTKVNPGMTKTEVLELAGHPHYIVGQNAPRHAELEEEQQQQYGFVVEIWHYMYPQKFAVHFKDDEVMEVKYFGELDLPPQEEKPEGVDL